MTNTMTETFNFMPFNFDESKWIQTWTDYGLTYEYVGQVDDSHDNYLYKLTGTPADLFKYCMRAKFNRQDMEWAYPNILKNAPADLLEEYADILDEPYVPAWKLQEQQ